MTESDTQRALSEVLGSIAPPDEAARRAALEHQLRLTKPPGSLGRLEVLGAQLAAISGRMPPAVPERPAVAVFAGDHGVVASGVTPWPQEVTAQMVANFCAGGAAVNVLARRVGASMMVVDVGVAGVLPSDPMLCNDKVRPGTDDLALGPAMSREEARLAVLVGVRAACSLVDGGADLLVGGDMGIGNTTPSAAIIAAITGRSAPEVTGRGTGIDDDMLALKTSVVAAAVDRLPAGTDAIGVLAELGGLEIAALCGFYLGAASRRVPVVVDGVIALAGALVAVALAPAAHGFLVAGHRSTEPAAALALDHLGLRAVLDLELRLGEGSGAVLAVPIVQAAAAILAEMATFGSAGVTELDD
ncbi:MAG: nicotinate-nucleotide--dimethylbenzimidazole phosphoribosyltransferase [Ilumatobacteraceae bacterium]